MTLRDLFSFLFKWKTLINRVTLSLFVLVTALTYVLDQSYTCTNKVVVESNRMPTMRDVFAPTSNLAELLTTEGEMVTSISVLTSVVDEVHPENRPKKKSKFASLKNQITDTLIGLGLIDQVSPRDKWIYGLAKQVKAKPVANSGILKIAYSDDTPEWAAEIVNSVTKHYIRHHLSVYEDKGNSELLHGQIIAAEQELDKNRQQIALYNQKTSVVALQEQKQELVHGTQLFKDGLIKAQSELADLKSRYVTGHKLVVLAQEKVDMFTTAIKKQQSELERLERSDSEGAKLRDVVANQEAQLQNLRNRYNEALERQANTIETLNVRVVDYSKPPTKPDSPRIFLISLSLVLGFFLSVALAMLLEYFDHKVDDKETAQDILNLPSLGYVPFSEQLADSIQKPI